MAWTSLCEIFFIVGLVPFAFTMMKVRAVGDCNQYQTNRALALALLTSSLIIKSGKIHGKGLPLNIAA
jgi:hypothetical protein